MKFISIIRKRMPAAIAGVALMGSLAYSSALSAAAITPTFDVFGTLVPATFGGSGIPNDAVAITTIVDGGNTITLGMSATRRFSNPPLSNDGAGTFGAGPGANFGGAGESASLGALWNFDYFIAIAGGGTIGDYIVELFYDFDPGVGTNEAELGVFNFNDFTTIDLSGLFLIEDSQNLLFGFWATVFPGNSPPAYPAFDPNATGEYSFALRVSNSAGEFLGQSAINVNVPEPGTLALFAFGLVGLGFARRRKAV